jgi:anaerobic selenocysteine-containing dehydrogenase
MIEPETVKKGICYMCTDRCPIKIHVRNGKATQIDIADDAVAYCPRWKAQLDFIYHPDRLKYPMKRTGERGAGSFTRISWDEALDTTAANLQKAKDKYGAESVVFYIAYTKEPRPYFHRLVHAFGSPNYCTESSSCFSGTAIATILTYGPDFLPFAIQSITADPASKCKIIWGTGYQDSVPNSWRENLEARKRGLKLIVVDPRRTTIASMADIHLQLRPGTDGALALGMMNIIINQNLHDKEFTEKWTVGFDDLKKLVQEYPPERVAEITWVPAAQIREAALLYATQKPAKIGLSNDSTTHHANGVQNHRAIILLAAITGNMEVAGGNGYPTPNQPINDITLHERVANMPPGVGSKRFPIWTQRYSEMQSNAIADQIESGDPYPLKAMFSSGLNVQFFPNSNRMVENLKKLDFIAINEYFPTPTTQLADIVLPIASWLERHILMADYGVEIVRLIQPAIEPVGESWPEWKIYSELAKRLGFGDLFWDGDFEKCVNYMLEPIHITYEDLKQHPEGINRPLPKRPEKYYEQAGFLTPSGKVEIASSILAEHGLDPLPVYKEPPESPLSRPDLAESYPLVLTSGARLLTYTHSQFRNITQLRQIMPEPQVDINPADATPRGIKSGDKVTISSPRGSIQMTANVTDTILPGVVSLPHHWPVEANVNLLTDDQNLDPISGFPPFKSQLCQVTKC